MNIQTLIELDRKKSLETGDKLKRTVLGTLLDALQKVAKRAVPPRDSATDSEAINEAKRLIEGICQTREFLIKSGVTAADPRIIALDDEQSILHHYVPSQMVESEILTALKENAAITNKGQAMSHLKSNYAGRYDGKLAAQVVDEYLTTLTPPKKD